MFVEIITLRESLSRRENPNYFNLYDPKINTTLLRVGQMGRSHSG